MTIIGQPADYSQMLKRIFYTSVASGLICTVLLAGASPAFRSLLDSVKTEADIGPLKGIEALYVAVPLVIGLISRILKLHDRISDLLRIRHRFDTRHLLFPLAEGAGLTLTKELEKKIRSNRVSCMYAVFYPYAGFKSPTIDEQLVRTAADNWGWLWVLIESSFLFVLTGLILMCLRNWDYVWWCLVVVVVETALRFLQFRSCRRGAKYQVQAILADPARVKSVAAHFQKL